MATGCGSGSLAAPPALPAALAALPSVRGPRLVEHNGALYVLDLPGDLPRGAFLYVIDPKPIGEHTQPPIGIVIVLEPEPRKVAWFCEPRSPIAMLLKGEGVPVDPLRPDKLMRFGDCWGRFESAEPDPKRPNMVRVRIDLGEHDGIRPGQQYELLGGADQDLDSGAATVPVVGLCTVPGYWLYDLHSFCVVDPQKSVQVTRADRPRGHVRIRRREPHRGQEGE